MSNRILIMMAILVASIPASYGMQNQRSATLSMQDSNPTCTNKLLNLIEQLKIEELQRKTVNNIPKFFPLSDKSVWCLRGQCKKISDQSVILQDKFGRYKKFSGFQELIISPTGKSIIAIKKNNLYMSWYNLKAVSKHRDLSIKNSIRLLQISRNDNKVLFIGKDISKDKHEISLLGMYDPVLAKIDALQNFKQRNPLSISLDFGNKYYACTMRNNEDKDESTVAVYNRNNHRLVGLKNLESCQCANPVALSPDDRLVAVATDTKCSIFEVNNIDKAKNLGNPVYELEVKTDEDDEFLNERISALAFSCDNKSLILANKQPSCVHDIVSKISLYDLTTKKITKLGVVSGAVKSIHVIPDTNLVRIAKENNQSDEYCLLDVKGLDSNQILVLKMLKKIKSNYFNDRNHYKKITQNNTIRAVVKTMPKYLQDYVEHEYKVASKI